MTNCLRLSGPYARLLLLWIMGRISHFTLWNLLMNIPIWNPHLTHVNILPLETTRLLLTHKNCWDAPSSWTLRKMVRGSVPRIVECISNHESNNEDEYEEIITYNELMDFIKKNQENDAIVWRFRRIVGHQGPLLQHDKDYNGLRFNVLVKWENGEIMTEPLGKPITMTHYQDANLYHDIITGRSVTAILHFLNKFLINWYSKKQATVETATYGSEYILARTCVNQMVDL
jgi:hypothetical protein